MKKDWTYKKLGEVATYINGFPFKPSDWKEEGKPIIRIQNLTGNQSHYNRCNRTDIPSKYIVKKGDILISWSATLGVYEWEIEDALLNQHIFKVVFDKLEINKSYFKYAIQISIDEMSRHTNGATMKHIRKGDFDNISIPLPPLSEQQEIVSRLDAAFGEIEGLKAKAEAQLREARTLFQAALTQEMKPKQGWEEKKLKEIGTTQTGTTPSKNDKDNYGDFIPFIRPSEIDYDGCGGLKYDSEIKLSEKGLSNGRLFKAGSILMVCIGATISKVGVTSEDVSCNQQINVLKPKQEYDSKFIYYAMRNEDFKQKVIKEGTSSQATLPIINKGKWENLSLSLPPLPVQQSIVSRLDALSEKVRELEETQKKVIAECDALKQALLREVFE